MKLRPVRFEPIFDERPWGVRSLAPLFPERNNLSENIGEAWLTGEKCRFATGDFAGRTVGEMWRELSAAWIGSRVRRDAPFPILLKFLFTGDKPSVQVHPDDEYAARVEPDAGGRGKTEMWYAIAAIPGAEVLVGLRREVTAESFRRAIADGTAEECLERIPIHTGDAVFVPAGTAHTIGGGLVLCEIQEYSDITYRVYDYQRRNVAGEMRPLHVEKAMEVIRFGAAQDAGRGGKCAPIMAKRGPVTETYIAACRYFATEKWEFSERIAAEISPEHFDLMIFLDGSGAFEIAGERIEYRAAGAWMLPAELGKYHLAPTKPTTLLRTYVPSSLAELARRLKAQGVPESELPRLVYS